MVTSAVLYLIVLWLMNSLRQTLRQAHFLSRFIITTTIWSVLLAILSLVSVSRVFIATHFPHQVILGTVIGLFVASTVRKHSSVLFEVSHSVLYCTICSIVLVVTTLASHIILSILIYDPSISVTKAQKWCVKPSYIHLDTTPFYALVRDSGTTLGLGMSFLIVGFVTRVGMNNWRGLRNMLLSRSLKIILSVFLLQLLEAISLPKSNPLLFYVAGYGRCALIPIIIIFVVPMIVLS